ncbi:MAG: NADH:flavin oxidoreductase/NADH oxidase [Mucilaginibacter sp.]|nr:NADH:flavin oxidoreductase/NADH oxidase [Mucilaginibacter sp.]
MKQPLLTTYELGAVQLKNRIVMAPMTRRRVTNNDLAPTTLNTTYYAQRAGAGLIITEGTAISPTAIGFINVPGIYSTQQIAGWKLVTDAVHAKAGKIFVQLAHGGAASHPDFYNGEIPAGPSAINPGLQAFTQEGFKDTVIPRAFTTEEIKAIVKEFSQAALNAKQAGFDGIELHAQIYTLIPQFLSAATNQRMDEYGGSIENRARFLFEVLEELIKIYGKQVGIKFSPAAFNPGLLKPDGFTIDTFDYILNKLNNYDLGYVHLLGPDRDLKGTPIEALQDNYFSRFRNIYQGTLIANLGFTQQTGNKLIDDGLADLVSFAAPFIANPDLPRRFELGIPLAEADQSTYYSGGATGYTDYPVAVKG